MKIDTLIGRLTDLNDELANSATRHVDNGRSDEAEALEQRRRRLSTEIDRLSGVSHQQWHEAAMSVREKIERHNRKIASKLRQVEREVEAIKDFSRFLEHLDQLVKLAAAVVK